MKSVTAFEAKTRLSALLDMASHGETIVVTRRGQPIAQIGPLRQSHDQAKEAMEFILSQKIRLGMPVRKAIQAGRRR